MRPGSRRRRTCSARWAGTGMGLSPTRTLCHHIVSPCSAPPQCVNELNQWLSALRKVCGNNPQLLHAYHPGVFRGDKWSCCHQKDRTGTEVSGCGVVERCPHHFQPLCPTGPGCGRTRHSITLQDWSDPLQPDVEAQRLFQHLHGLQQPLRLDPRSGSGLLRALCPTANRPSSPQGKVLAADGGGGTSERPSRLR